MDKKILLVDDEVDFIEINKLALENKGYRVVAAYDEKEALDKALEEKPDLIILDVMLKTRTGGFSVSRELRKYEEIRDTPIIMITAIRERMDVREEIEPDKEWLPVTEILEKPVAPDRLIEKVAEVLHRTKR